MAGKTDMAKFAKFCKDTGFIFQSSEIYGGINGFWDYGPLGVELKKNIKDAWWQDMVRNPPPGPDGQEIRMVGLDCSIIMNPQVWEASGHVGAFGDPTRKCPSCGKFTRADQLWPILQECEWMNSFIDAVNAHATTADDVFGTTVFSNFKSIRKWVESKGLKLAANLAVVRNPQVILSAFEKLYRERKLIGNDCIRFLATENIDTTGFQDPCPACGGPLGEAKQVSLMFESHAGLEKTEDSKVYLRPETAQGIFANYRNVLNSTRVKLPFGVAQIGKAFRNEVNPRNFTFRSREFEQMEIEFFCHPSESFKWYAYWRDVRVKWYSTLNIQSEKLIPREQSADERAFYSVGTTDIEYMFPFSDEPQELEGVAHRADYDLTQHAKHSGKVDDLAYFDEELWNNDSQTMSTRSFKEWLKSNPSEAEIAKYKFVPHVIEPSAGADRFTLAVLMEAYTEEELTDAKGQKDTRIVMKFHPRLAPIKAAIFPLVNKDGMPEVALKLYRELKPFFNVFYDDKGAVGRRYRRQDEIGTPFCITIDGDSVKDGTVTIRERDSMQQRRIAVTDVRSEIFNLLMPNAS